MQNVVYGIASTLEKKVSQQLHILYNQLHSYNSMSTSEQDTNWFLFSYITCICQVNSGKLYSIGEMTTFPKHTIHHILLKIFISKKKSKFTTVTVMYSNLLLW